MGFKFITIRSLIWFATTSIYFQVDVELEKKRLFHCRLHGLAWNQNVIQKLNIGSCNHCHHSDLPRANRPDSLPPLPSEGVWWNVVGFWLHKAKWASWAWGHYFRYLVYTGPGIRYLNLLVSLALTWDQPLFFFFYFLLFFASLLLQLERENVRDIKG